MWQGVVCRHGRVRCDAGILGQTSCLVHSCGGKPEIKLKIKWYSIQTKLSNVPFGYPLPTHTTWQEEAFESSGTWRLLRPALSCPVLDDLCIIVWTVQRGEDDFT